MKTVRIGSGAGCCKDRIEPVEELIEKGNIDYLVFETLAERSFAQLQLKKAEDPHSGYNEMLEVRMRRTLKKAVDKGIKIIANMGGANPPEAVKVVERVAAELGIKIKIAMVEGDDIFPYLDKYTDNERWQFPGETIKSFSGKPYYANVYLGGEPVCEALDNGADVVITGRIADASLFSGTLMHAFGWQKESRQMGQAILVGHLLECCGQLTGGFFAEPSGKKQVPGLERLGFPIAEVYEDGSFIVTKTEDSGGIVSIDTCKEQLFYEITDPSCYKTPDGIVDFTGVKFEEIGKNRVKVTGAVSKGIPETLKVNVGLTDGYKATGTVIYSGNNSLELAKYCADIIWKRLEIIGVDPVDKRTDYIGYNAVCKSATSDYYRGDKFSEIMLKMSVRTKTKAEAEAFADEFGFLYTNGPAGSTGMESKVVKACTVTSIFIPREDVKTSVSYKEVR